MSEPMTPEPGSARRWPVALVLGVLLVAGAMALRGYLQRAETRRAHLAAVERQNLGAPAELERLDAGTTARLESCDEPCATRGACTLRDGRCVATSAESCRESQLCGDDGMCSLVDERCEPASDADCAAPTPTCAAATATCVGCATTGCPTGQTCGADGRCAAAPSALGASCAQDADCASRVCFDYGAGPRCTRSCGRPADCDAGFGCHMFSGARMCIPTASAPAAAQNQSPIEAAYENDRAALQASLEAAAEPTHAVLFLSVSSLQDTDVAEGFSPMSRKPQTNIAIEGYDPVGYFAGQKSMKGSPDFTVQYHGAVFYFASAENRDRFAANPSRFAPAYGGYCTATIAKGVLTTDDPVNWTLHGNRLYLASSPSTQKSLRENLAYTIESADRYWASAASYLDQYGFGSSAKLVQPAKRLC